MCAQRSLTTAIAYPNGEPHIGFAFESILADTIARYWRSQGEDVRFQTGTDDNSLKIVLKAEKLGEEPGALVARLGAKFQDLKEALNLSTDDFIHTSTDPRHAAGVARMWKACADKGDIYKQSYSGLYCVGCEQFYTEEELDAGKCPVHETVPDKVDEENYFFKLTNYQDQLREAISSGTMEILPETRRNEVLKWVEDIQDFSISRSAERARGWGIPVPGDASQVIYVWFDALGNYVTALDYANDGEEYVKYWRDAAAREHMIGKDITRFHAVYWPAMLLSAGVPIPTRIYVHGFMTVDGSKISKSKGKSVDPFDLAQELGIDAMRYYLLRHIPSGADGDFSHERFRLAYDSELLGGLGNYASRVLSMAEKNFPDGLAAPADGEFALLKAAQEIKCEVRGCFEKYALNSALDTIWGYIYLVNKYIQDTKPWELAKAGDTEKLRACLWEAVEALYEIAGIIAPFLPGTAEKIYAQLGLETDGGKSPARPDVWTVKKGALLFPKVEEKKEDAAPKAGAPK